MSAEILRKAAALMRERAEILRDVAGLGEKADPRHIPWTTVLDEYGGDLDPVDHNYIASWHPAVALAVADWLDGLVDAMTNPEAPNSGVTTTREEKAALTIALAYVGEG